MWPPESSLGPVLSVLHRCLRKRLEQHDLDIDGDVGIADFLLLLGNWG